MRHLCIRRRFTCVFCIRHDEIALVRGSPAGARRPCLEFVPVPATPNGSAVALALPFHASMTCSFQGSRRGRLAVWVSIGIGFLVSIPAAGATLVAKTGDASLSHDITAGTWAIAAGGATLTLNLDSAKDFSVASLVTASNRVWITGVVPDTSVVVDGRPLAFGSRQAGFSYNAAMPSASGTTLRLDAVFDLLSAGLQVTRHYAVTTGSSTFETWTTYAPLAGARVTLSNLSALELSVPNGAVRWLTGLQGDTADTTHDSAFTLEITWRWARTAARPNRWCRGSPSTDRLTNSTPP